MPLDDTQHILIVWIAITVAGFAIFSYFADRRGRHRRKP